MQVEVIGGGAIGLLLASKLALAGCRATVWTRSEEQSAAIQAEGIQLVSEDGLRQSVTANVSALSFHESNIGKVHLTGTSCILLCVKQTAVDDLFISLLQKLVARTPNGTSIIALQNGIGHMERLASALAPFPVYAAVTAAGAKRESGTTVRHTGEGPIFISEEAHHQCRNRGEKDAISQKMLLEALEKAGFQAFLSNDMKNRIFQKLLVNAVINPLTAIFDVQNGELPLHSSRLKWMRELHDETKSILVQAGMADHAGSWEQILDVCRKTSGNVSSMLGDVRAGRQTEIRSINGAVAELAARNKGYAPLNGAVVALIEALGRDFTGEGIRNGRDMG
ncbi:ketopantoate reductase family protein [Paenibacillus sp. GCM10027627]|uniref:ketopantoate reductase family protein n=1 Tax=unclassified Paenibacillus TaxID=185978 RepID=UPI00363F0BCA